ncbi:Slp family lipoprotein [Edwardsiella tarda]
MSRRIIRAIAAAGVVGLMGLLAGCVSVPESVRGTSPTPQQNFVAVQNAPDLYVGQEARFGGMVVSVTNKKEASYLEIAVMPLDDAARPILGQAAQGRILAKSVNFLDPVNFNHQLVTVVGPLTGSVAGKIGQTPYTFVTLDITGYQRWQVDQQVIMPPQPLGLAPWGYDPYWRGPYWGPGFGPGWGWGPPMPARIENVVVPQG